MATAFSKTQVVKVKTVVPTGPIEALRMDEEGNVFYRISWIDVKGASNTRWFAEHELELA